MFGGGKEHEVPCHHLLAEYLDAYIEAAGLGGRAKVALFQGAPGRGGVLSGVRLTRGSAWSMVRRRCRAFGIMAPVSNHTFRATGITAFMENGGTLEDAALIAAHESPRTTKLYDRTEERIGQEMVERIRL